ncbi:hypothetical protein TVAG_189660 [Trichomonas vaginalis G3]|uniref:Uncharacterized protein n=1 Tax=Trichomonas vaginalis (strain ATCC PRA-98 / G3) TaxID=412133 RepID=A2DK98_TRIV3|nr:WD40 repeat family [Trichomonas vaginalis G3]EAY19075.1 hypothetical protein TVAG_189660 [Trichomonas vaginalis G3]KAI5490375.1 WD40 repeat family [Trichomonas vaginalis G3]|eukprot:XP_001580061.1 hypothetical protein [Trichomonas vaginalis G3]
MSVLNEAEKINPNGEDPNLYNQNAALDKMIGSSPIDRQKFTMHHGQGVCAFIAGGIVSVVKVNQQQRNDFQISDNTHEIDVIFFSRTGRQLAIGTKGPFAKFYVVTFNENFDQIVDKIEKKTDENGFSAIDIESESGKLITVGVDLQPFIILWDIKQGKPEAIGRYHIKCVPNHISLSNDGNFAIVSGPSLLRIIDTSVGLSDKEIQLLKTRSISISKFRTSNFVSAYSCSNSFGRIYALTDDGTLLSYERSCVDFSSQIKCNKITLGCGSTKCMVVDEKLVLIGTDAGSVLAVKCDSQQHALFGQFSADGYPVVSVCCSTKIVGVAYNNGSMIFYPRRPGKQPLLTIQQHRGPVCCLSVCPGNDEKYLVSGGSDGSCRKWEIIKQQDLVSGSSQHMVASNNLCKASDDYLTSIKGIRCVCASEKYTFAGDNNGILHVMRNNKLDIVTRIEEKSRGTTAICCDDNDKYLATGGLDGIVRIYSYKKEDEIKVIAMDPTHTSPVTSICFCGGSLISTSKEGVRFAKLPTGVPYKTSNVDDMPLSISPLPNKKYVATCGMDKSISIWRISDGFLFRKYQLSIDEKPTCLSVDKSGLFIAVGMSSSIVNIIDIFSGDIICNFNSVCGLPTNIVFQQNDIILSGMSGCIARWNLPEFIYKIIQERQRSNVPLDLLMGLDEEPSHSTILDDEPKLKLQRQASSTLKGAEANTAWTFVENKEDKNGQQEVVVEDDGQQDQTDDSQLDYDHIPRPAFGERDHIVDDIIRASFIGKDSDDENGNQNQNENEKPELSSSGETDSSIMKMLDSIKKKKNEDNKDYIIIGDDTPSRRKEKLKLDIKDPPNQIKGVDDDDLDPFIIDELEKDSSTPHKSKETTPKQPEMALSPVPSSSSQQQKVLTPPSTPPQQILLPVTVVTPPQIDSKQSDNIPYPTRVAEQLKLLLSVADDFLQLETEDPGELEALNQLKDVMNEIERSALQSNWLKKELIEHISQIFDKK